MTKGKQAKLRQAIRKFWDRSYPVASEFIFQLFVYLLVTITFIGVAFYIILRAVKPDSQPIEMALVTALLGSLALAGGFVNKGFANLAFHLRRIGALYLFATIAFLLFGFHLPIDALQNKSEIVVNYLTIVMGITMYTGAIAFTAATTWLLVLLPRFFKRKPSKKSDS